MSPLTPLYMGGMGDKGCKRKISKFGKMAAGKIDNCEFVWKALGGEDLAFVLFSD